MAKWELFYFSEYCQSMKHLHFFKIRCEKSVKELEFYFFEWKIRQDWRAEQLLHIFWGNDWKGMYLISISGNSLAAADSPLTEGT